MKPNPPPLRPANPADRPIRMSDWARYLATTQVPRLVFGGRTLRQYREWQRAFAEKYREMRGPFPRPVPLKPAILDQRVFPNYIRQKVIFNSEASMAVPAWVCLPRPLRRGWRYPAVVCSHGHGYGAKTQVGLDAHGKPGLCAQYGHLAMRLAQHGYVAIAPDWRVFGERAEPPEHLNPSVDPCNVVNLVAEAWGYHLLTLDIWDAMKTVDYLTIRPEVDPQRIGCAGLSFGGTMSLHLAASDRRIRAACICGAFSERPTDLGIGGCGSQLLPGLARWGGAAELAGLICPRPLLIQTGEYDTVSPSPGARREFARLKTIYQAASASSKLDQDLFDGNHVINFQPILEWFNRWL